MFKTLLFICFTFIANADTNPLQEAIDSASSGSVVKLSKGIYKGNIVIDKPISILAKEDGVVIEGSGSGTVITIKSSHVKLQNLKIIKSGNRADAMDAAVFINNSQKVVVENCTIEESLFGIFMDNVGNSAVLNNKISSNSEDIGLRGDGLRLWFSHDNVIKNNSFTKSRDIVFMRSNNNAIENNYMQECRFAIYTHHSKNIIIKENRVKESAIGIFLEGSMDINVTDNIVAGHHGAQTSLGILFKGASNIHVEKNSVGECNQALYIDNSPKMQETKNRILDNKIMYSTRGLDFKNHSIANVIKNNKIFGNMDNIMTDSRNGRTNENEIEGNYWDDYEGFDINKDNIGDSSHKKYLYLDQLWVNNPELMFFYGSPVLSMLNFLLKIAPFMEPIFLIEDNKPIFQVTN